VESGMHVLTSRTNAPVSKATQLLPYVHLSLSFSRSLKFDKDMVSLSGSLSFMQPLNNKLVKPLTKNQQPYTTRSQQINLTFEHIYYSNSFSHTMKATYQ